MKKIFNEIWEEREHVSEISGKSLLPKGHPQWHWQFAHILGKNVAPSWKENKENIMLMLPSEHENQEQYPKFIDIREQRRTEYFELKKLGLIK